MKREISWIARVVIVALVTTAGAVVGTTLNEPEQLVADTPGCALEVAPAGIEYAVQKGREEDLLEPAAICRLMPECWKNSDCDVQCGIGLGKCVHSNCPVRICRCR